MLPATVSVAALMTFLGSRAAGLVAGNWYASVASYPISILQVAPPEIFQNERVFFGSITSALGLATLLIAGIYVLFRGQNDELSQLLLIVIGGGFTSVFTGLIIATTGYLAAAVFVIAMAVLYGTLVNFYVRTLA